MEEDKVKLSILEAIKKSNPTLDASGVELIYEQHIKAYEDHLKYIEELNSNLLKGVWGINPPTYN